MDKGLKIALGVSLGVLSIGVVSYIFRDKIKQGLKNTLGGYKWFDESLQWYRDQKTKDIIEGLHPKVKDKFKEFISRVEKELGLQIIATSGFRTDEKQESIKLQNSQNASAGRSHHNYGLALDINVIDMKTNNIILRKSTPKKQWQDSRVVAIAKDMGMSWGGEMFPTYYDPVHFYYNIPINDLYALRQEGKIDKNGYILDKYINV